MKRSFAIVLVTAAMASVSTSVVAQGRRPFATPPARIVKPQPGGSLTLPSTASPRAILRQYLREQGRDEATAQSLVDVSQSPAPRDGVRHVRFEQRAAGLPVYGTYAKAAFTSRGELVHLVENLVQIPGGVSRAGITEQQAIRAAVDNLYPNTVPASFFRRTPSATRVAIPNADGSMSAGFIVETWTQQTNQLHYTLIGGDGAILGVESRTHSDSYRVFRESPTATPQEIVSGGPGWLFSGAQRTVNIAGNNVHAYLDTNNNNKPDGGGSTVTNGEFLAMANLAESPSTDTNREVAIQNLFFLNNVIHDELYRHGFTEAAGNFQESNGTNGGRDGDSVNAEGQDGGGIDNANFATPNDGVNPRMQMYLWTGKGVNEVVVNSPSPATFRAQGTADWGAPTTVQGVTGDLALANDGKDPTTDACEAIPGSLAGMIALIDRGLCDFTVKVKNVQNAGALAAIIANTLGRDSIITMGGADSSITIPAVFIGNSDGDSLKAALAAGSVNVTVRKKDPPPLMRDGDLDSDVVFHEYCHGLTWRMIGHMNGALAGAVGEGMSDICALLMNEDDVMGEYSTDDPVGIRRFPYDGYPNTYGDVTGGEVHDDGEIYAAIGWSLFKRFAGRKDALFDYLVDGMNYTPAQPTYEQMRDGILAAVGNADNPADECLVWQAFAEFGVGVNAKGLAKGQTKAVISESFALPATCQP
jgi:extracellular elastinolytic metalloproteinase